MIARRPLVNVAAARDRFLKRRQKALTLVEELSLLTRRVQPLIQQLEDISTRMLKVQARIAKLGQRYARQG